MNWHYRSDASRSVIFVTADGLITQAELTRGAATITADPAFHRDIRVLLDFSGATAWDLRARALSELGSLPQFSAKSRRAFLVQEGLPRAMFSVHQMSAISGSVGIFTDRAKALAWLNEGVPADWVVT